MEAAHGLIIQFTLTYRYGSVVCHVTLARAFSIKIVSQAAKIRP